VTFAGNAQGRDGGASIAIAVTDGHAVAYLCDGKRIEAWLQGTATNGELTLTGAGDASLTGSYDNGGASGEVAAAGQRFAFSVKVVKPPSGLYRATANVRGARVVGGWIVQADGTQVGLLVVDGEVLEAPALNTATNSVIVDGTPIEAEPVDGTGL
jgi:serine/threonine-protein kinase